MANILDRRIAKYRGGVSKFDPSSFGNVRLWFRADTSVYQDSGKVTRATKTGDPVGYWTNQGPDADFSQSTNANRPTLQLNAINGWPAIKFASASSQFMTTAGNVQVNWPHTTFIMAMFNGATGGSHNQVMLALGNPTVGGGAWEFGVKNGTSPAVILLKDQNDPYYTGTSPVIQRGQPFLLSVQGLGSDNKDHVYVNGSPAVAASVNTSSTSNLTHSLFLGEDPDTTTRWDGLIAEILLFDRPSNLTATQFQEVNSYFLYKYGFYGIGPSTFPKPTNTA